MKEFLGEYGGVILVGLVIAILVLIIGSQDAGIGKTISDGIKNAITSITQGLTPGN